MNVIKFPMEGEDYILNHLKNFVSKAHESDQIYIYEFVDIYIEYLMELGEDRTWVQDNILIKLTDLSAWLELDLQE